MSIHHTAGDRTPYVYVIKFVNPDTGEKRWYIGSRYGKDCHPSDLLCTYTTNSEPFKKLYDDFGASCFSGKVVKILDNREDAVPYEGKLFRRAESFGLKRKRELINHAPPGVKSCANYSDEWRLKHSLARLGKKRGPMSEETKLKIANSKIGKPRSSETRLKLSKSYRFIDPQGQLHEFTGLVKFCDERDLHKSHMAQVAKGNLKHYKGWRAAA